MKYFVLCITLNLLFFANIVSTAVDITPIYGNESLNLTIFNNKYPFTLSCKVTGDTNHEIEIKWRKDDKFVNEVDSLKGRATTKKKDDVYSLTIEHSIEDDAGNYSCIAFNKSTDVKEASIQAVCAVKLKPSSENINVVEAEKLRIVCNIIGKPPPEISWTVLNETYTKSLDRVILEEDPDKKIPNAVLIINEVQMSDRGIYKCIAFSNVTKTEESVEVMVRIKDKYAALWPFLGICAEVFVLCAIILVYEKKRNKTELEESDTDQSPDQKNTPDHGKEANLRHRQ